MAEVGFISKDAEAAALRQSVKMKPYRPDWIKECGYFNEHVRTLLEDRFGRDPVYNLGLKVYTTADVSLHQGGPGAIDEGIDGLVQRNGYRGPLRHLKRQGPDCLPGAPSALLPEVSAPAGTVGHGPDCHPGPPQPGPDLPPGRAPGDIEEEAGAQTKATSLRASLQPGDVVQVRLVKQDRRQGKWTASVVAAPMVQAGLLSIELKTGKVRAMIGGKDFGDSTFNRAIQARRQPGSAFKPIIYAAAIDKGFRPDSILQDAPISLPGGKRGQAWDPRTMTIPSRPHQSGHGHRPFPERAHGAADDGHRRARHPENVPDPGYHLPHLS